jgi:hypothetical protein
MIVPCIIPNHLQLRPVLPSDFAGRYIGELQQRVLFGMLGMMSASAGDRQQVVPAVHQKLSWAPALQTFTVVAAQWRHRHCQQPDPAVV